MTCETLSNNLMCVTGVLERKKKSEAEKYIKEKITRVPIVAQQKRIQLVSMRIQVQFLALFSGSRIWCCCELWCRSQKWPGSYITVAVV